MHTRKITLLTLVMLFTFSLAARAADVLLDPELLRISPIDVAEGSVVQTDPVPITSGGFRLTFHSDGSFDDLIDPVLLILAVPDGTAAPTLTAQPTCPGGGCSGLDSASVSLGGSTLYGGTWNTVTGFAGQLDPGEDVYSQNGIIGLDPAANGSMNYTNFDLATTGISAWDLYVYKLTTGSSFSAGDWVDIVATGAVAGTFVMAYGCDATTGSGGSTKCDGTGNTFSTPFTWAGLVTGGAGQAGSGQAGSGQAGAGAVPEPASLMLLGTGLGIAASRFRNRAKRQASR